MKTENLMRRLPILAALLALAAAAPAAAQVKHVGPAASPIAKAVVVPAGYTTVYVSGITPQPVAAGAPALGDTKTQTISILTQIQGILKDEGLTMGDVVMMRVLLVGDAAKEGKMDFAGMMEGYKMFFGTAEQPNKPARITSQVAALVSPLMLAEIEVQAVKKP
jgi:enamine deaminase RidA (YjgF/YER057c/UK114 family)